MKALVVRQPYASQIIDGTKTIEYRTWQTGYRGPILIVAGKSREENGTHGPYGAALGIVHLASIGLGTVFEWHLRHPEAIPTFPVRGRLGLFEVQVPPYLARALNVQ